MLFYGKNKRDCICKSGKEWEFFHHGECECLSALCIPTLSKSREEKVPQSPYTAGCSSTLKISVQSQFHNIWISLKFTWINFISLNRLPAEGEESLSLEAFTTAYRKYVFRTDQGVIESVLVQPLDIW